MEEKKVQENALEKQAGSLRRRVDVMVVLLILEFILGMVVNLFGEAPSESGKMQEPTWATLVFLSHGILGILLLIWAIFLFVFVNKTENKKWRSLGMQGMIGIVVSAMGGVAFVGLREGSPADISSLVMALGFLYSFISYGRLLFTLRPSPSVVS
ncbi:MAG: hypothetical protein Q8Q49_05165 [bacterium]|nr:hypothetical protein [bacterium]